MLWSQYKLVIRHTEFLRKEITGILNIANRNSDFLTLQTSEFQKKIRPESLESNTESEFHYDGGPRNRNQKLEFPTKLQIILSFPYHIWCGICFWPRLYYRFYNPKAKGCLIWDIITDPKEKSSTHTKLKNMPSQAIICPLWLRLLVFSTYQVYGAYAHIHQKENADVSEAPAEAAGPALPKVWDPLHLAFPYQFLSAKLFEPPDYYMCQWMTVAGIIGFYLIPLCWGAAYLTYICLFPSPLLAISKKKRRRCHLRCIVLSTTDPNLQGHTTVTFNTDGIPFIVNNSAMCIITNERSLFVRNLTLAQVQVNLVNSSAKKH
jgi:hypothetical protein